MRSIAQWRIWKYLQVKYVTVACPGCGSEYRLDHDIDALGVVSPSIECPAADCGFHDTVILVGWMEGVVGKSGKA